MRSLASQQRGDHQTGFDEAFWTHLSHTLIAVVIGFLSYRYVQSFFWWFTPVLAGLALSIPVSMITSRVWLGQLARRAGIFLTPEETNTPRVLQLLEQNLEQATPPGCITTTAGDLWYRAVVDPCAHALHASLLPDETPNRRRRHYLEGLIFQLQDEGAGSLKPVERRALVSHRDGLSELHTLLWSAPTPPSTASAQDTGT